MALHLPTLRLFKTCVHTLDGTETLNLGVTGYNDIAVPNLSPPYKIHGLFAVLNQFKDMPTGYDAEGNEIHTDFINVVTITNTGDNTLKLIHDSIDCDPLNKMFFIPQTDHNLDPNYSITFHYKQMPTRTGWWEFQTK